MKPKITVYITNHNYEKFISKSIQSVLSQSFKNYELIIIDDGSSDDSVNVIDRFCKKNKDIIFVKQKKRGCQARLKCLQQLWSADLEHQGGVPEGAHGV